MYPTTIDAYRDRVDKREWRPRTCVWELTLACNLRCQHCGSRAGAKRKAEMTTEECFDVARQLAELNCELITLSGGEPTLRKDWHLIASSIASRGVFVNMVTNGAFGTDERRREIGEKVKGSGLSNLGISLDGPREIHDYIRGPGRFAETQRTIELFASMGIRVAVMTTINKLNLDLLEETRQIAIDSGATMWRVQLAKPMGNLEDNRSLALEPQDTLTLMPALARMKREGPINIGVGDSIGYYGPHDKVLREWGWRRRRECWQGCQAGLNTIGIESDGGVKGCLSMQAEMENDPFWEGNLRQSSLEKLWYRPGSFAYNRDFRLDTLTGQCARCRFGRLCRGGAKCVASAFTGALSEDPYCHHGLLATRRRQQLQNFAQPAQAAAAAFLISLGAAGAAGAEPIPDPYGDPFASPEEATTVASTEYKQSDEPEYGVDLDPGWADEYGIPYDPPPLVKPPVDPAELLPHPGPKPDPPSQVAPFPEPEYGVPYDPSRMEDYGIEYDPGWDDEYGIPLDSDDDLPL